MYDNDNLPRDDKLSVVGTPSPSDNSADRAGQLTIRRQCNSATPRLRLRAKPRLAPKPRPRRGETPDFV